MLPNIGFTEYQYGVLELSEASSHTGIGLTVARSLSRRLGGDIQLDTTYTDGARFVMTLPIPA